MTAAHELAGNDFPGPLTDNSRIWGQAGGLADNAPDTWACSLIYDYIKSKTDTLYPSLAEFNVLSGAAMLEVGSKWQGEGLIATNFANGVVSTDLATYGQVVALYAGATAFASATNILNATSIACWGDSLTAGAGGSPTYPAGLANVAGYLVYNGGVGGDTSTQIKTRMLADTAKYGWATIIWAGRNNYSALSTVLADVAAMVAVLGHTNYLVLSVLNGEFATEYSGGSDYTKIIALNTALSAAYGAHYLDIRAYLVSQYDSGTPQDVTDHGHDIPPSTLRSDTIHLNSAGYLKVAQRINQSITALQTELTVLRPSAFAGQRVAPIFSGPVAITGAGGGSARLDFLTPGASVGSGAAMALAGDGTTFQITGSGLVPYPDNTLPLGIESQRWSQVHAGSATFSTTGTALIVGTSASLNVGGNADNVQIWGTTSGLMSLGVSSATAGVSAGIDFYRSKNAAIGSATVVASGDRLGQLTFYGAQQTGTFATQSPAAQIRVEVDGTVTSGASGDMPGRIIFATTPDASGAIVDRLILDAAGILKPNANDGVALGTAVLSFSDLFLASGGVINWNNGDVTITHGTNLLSFAGAANGYTFDTSIGIGVASSTTYGLDNQSTLSLATALFYNPTASTGKTQVVIRTGAGQSLSGYNEPVLAFMGFSNTLVAGVKGDGTIGSALLQTIDDYSAALVSFTSVGAGIPRGISLGIDAGLGWASSGNWYNAKDVGLSRVSAGVLGVGNGTVGNAAGTLSCGKAIITSPAVNTSVLTSTGYSLTGSSTVSMVDLAGTLNTSGAPAVIKLNITNTASDSASMFASFQVAGSPRINFRITDGAVLASYFATISSNAIAIDGGNTALSFSSSAKAAWSSTANWYDSADTSVSRVSAGVVGVGTGAAASVAGTLSCATVIAGTAIRLNVTPTAVGTGVKTISSSADSSTNFGHYIAFNFNGTTYYVPCGATAPT